MGETVTLFGVTAGGWAAAHNGVDVRVNIHICLANCNSSRVVVGGKSLSYTDGGIFAFEDRLHHEVINEASLDRQPRLNLVIGALHPSFNPDVNPNQCSWEWPPP